MMQVQTRYRKGDSIGGRFLVHQALAGGMGEVYLCLDSKQDTPVALKTFQARHLSHPKIRDYFEREAMTWVTLENHPHIVRCYALEKVANQPFLLLEWVFSEPGKDSDLRNWFLRGAVSPQMALQVGIDLCRGLAHARRKVPGLVHCDLKLENVLIAQGDVAKITDFGLARVVLEAGLHPLLQSDVSSDGRHQSSAVGTPPYMAPEQWLGAEVDARTDLYALGCLLFELLNGRLPFEGRSLAELKQQHLAAAPPRMERLAGLGEQLSPVLERCLSKDKAGRWPTAEALLDELSRIYRQQWGKPRILPEGEDFTAEDYNNRGVTYHALGKHDEALTDLSAAVRLTPPLAIACYNRGVIYAAQGQHEQALADFDEALRRDPTVAQVHVNRGVSYQALGKAERALEDFNAALGLDPRFAQALSNRGMAYLEQGKLEPALSDLDEAIRIDPHFAQAYSNRGLIHAARENHGQALADFNESLRLDPMLARAYYNRGNAHAALLKHEQALADFDKAVELDPKLAMAYCNRAKVWSALGRLEQALADFSTTIALDASLAQAYYNRGVTYTGLGQPEAALADYNEAIRLDPTDVHAHNNRGILYAGLGNRELALADFEVAVQLDPGSAQSHANRASIRVRLGNQEAALADYDEVLRLDPTLAEVYYSRGTAYLTFGRPQKALADFNDAIRLDANHALAYSNRGIAYTMLGQQALAWNEFQEAIRRDPALAKGHFNLGVWYAERGELRQALSYFERAAELGEPTGSHFAAMVREQMEADSDSRELTQEAVAAFAGADSLEAMGEVIRRFPVLVEDEVIAALEQLIAQQVPAPQQAAFEQPLGWLRQLACATSKD